MTRAKKLVLSTLIALAFAASAIASAAPAQVAGDPSQWGHEAKKGSFDITELEQLAGQDPEFPVTPN